MTDLFFSANNCLVRNFSQQFYWKWFNYHPAEQVSRSAFWQGLNIFIPYASKSAVYNNQKAKHLFWKCTQAFRATDTQRNAQSASFWPSFPPTAAAKFEAISLCPSNRRREFLDPCKKACRFGSIHPGLFNSRREAAVNNRLLYPDTRLNSWWPAAFHSSVIYHTKTRSAPGQICSGNIEGSSPDLIWTLTQSLCSPRWWSPEGGCQ